MIRQSAGILDHTVRSNPHTPQAQHKKSRTAGEQQVRPGGRSLVTHQTPAATIEQHRDQQQGDQPGVDAVFCTATITRPGRRPPGPGGARFGPFGIVGRN